ncbi:metal-dependent hydrolase [Pullulanibacillus sp. KACC 23026]|uniref:metal-dependent hydrolase n=1 Tax=Pullulanibacillus sp. KACC 23026 TaxID=3028315 RepID=UPI0023AEFF9C|nr:metal-dependent hydrolase [Pullulanibacillus sp. KACC 23026]WEG12275.1 metal-dependent hydrolase [Pullulanibacillus sp. KACC 23026]
MDTGTHVVMGIGLAALSTLDPVITHDPYTVHACLVGTLVGSLVPDIDTVLKLKDNATYIRHHRGNTHSLPATFLWPILITALITHFSNTSSILHIWLWTFFAVALHVFVDIFNAYGTQALRPINNNWIALGIINIFDPCIFALHILGFAIWMVVGYPGYVFLAIYGILILYYFLRIWHHKRAKALVRKHIPEVVDIYLSPTYRWTTYHLSAKSKTQYFVGEIKGSSITLIDIFPKKSIPEDKLFQQALEDTNIDAFLHFSPIYRWEREKREHGEEIRFIDLRYFSNGRYPFAATVWIDDDGTIISSFTGWVFSDSKLKKKLTLASEDH